ncbi:MAG: hypothetical protein AB4372_20010 [Xenococcus sp. (in: cyanobacteria)]
MKNFSYKKILSVIVLTILISLMIISTNSIPVASQSLTSINAELSSLRSRVNRLESEIRRIGRPSNLPNNRPANPPSNTPPTDIDGNLIGRSDPLFERFATLLIELKEDVKDLNKRLIEVENQIR